MGHIAIVLMSSLLIVAHLDGTSATGTYRTLFEYPADALGVNDLEGQEDAPIAVTQKSRASDELDKLRRSIPGEPDVDYPIFRTPPETDFSCKSRTTGYYADVESRCQAFRVCTNTDLTGKGFAFLCPNGTLFNQEVFVCDWYPHVDCSASENHYGKNAMLNMKINSMSEMMKVVNEMMNFPLKTNGERPIAMPVFKEIPRVTQRPPAIRTTIPFVAQTTPRPNQFPLSTPSPPFGSRIPNFNTPKVIQPTPTPTTPRQRRPGFGTKTFTQEGDIEMNSKNGFDRTKTVQQNSFSNQPIFISSLGELSTDPGNKFDINRAKIIKPEENQVITPAPRTKEQQLKQSLSESFRNRANYNNGSNPGETNLANGLQRVLQQNPDFQVQVLSGEADLLQFIEQILQRNPDLTPDRLNAILSAESEAILQILNDAVNRNQSGEKSRENEILDKIQQILNKYKNNRVTVPISSGGADLLESLKRILVRSQSPIFSGEGDLISFIELLAERNPEFTKQQLNAIISGEADSISFILNQKRQQNNGIRVKSGEAILLDAIENILQKYRGRPQTVPVQTAAQRLQIQSGEGNLLENALRRIQQQSQIPIFSGEADLISFIEQIVKQNPDFTKQQLGSILNGEADSISTILNQKRQRNDGSPIESGEAILLEAIQIVLQKYRGQNIAQPQLVPSSPQSAQRFVQSGEGNLLEGALRQIEQQSQIPVFSGEANLISFIEQIVQRNPDFTKEQLGAIISGEASSISTIVNQKRQRNIGVPVESGEAILLEAIEIVLQKYRGQPQTVPTQSQAQKIVQSGEANLLENALRRIQQQSQIPIFSGEANLISFIEQIVQRNPDFTKEQLDAIISGEANSISSIVNQKKQRNSGIPIESGEAILLEAIEIVLQKYRDPNAQSPPVSIPAQPAQRIIQSGENNLLESALRRIQQQSQIPIFSGEADLISFIEQIVERNPDFSKQQLSGILNGEANSISTIVNQKRQRNNGVPIESGEAILLEAIEIVLQKYRNNNTPSSVSQQFVPTLSGEGNLINSLRQIQQQNQIPIFSGEADLISFIEQIVQKNPDFTKEQLGAIISGESNAISSIVNQKRQQNNGIPIESGEAILLEAIEIVLQKYRGPNAQPQPIPIATQPTRTLQPAQAIVQSGEGNLLEGALNQIQQQIQIPVFSGEANLISFIEQIVQRNPDFTKDQLGSIISGEASSISTIVNQKRQRNIGVPVESGEAILLEAIEIVLQKYRGQPQTVPTQSQVQKIVQSGEANLLENALRRIQQQSQIPVFSGEANLISFIEQIVEKNRDFTKEQLGAIISGEANSISKILNEKRQRNNGIPIESGEANLLEAIQIVLQKYRSNTGILNQLQPPFETKTGTGSSFDQQGTVTSITNQNGFPQKSQPLSTLSAVKIVTQPSVNGGDSSNRASLNQNLNGNGIKLNSFKPVSNEQGRGIVSQSPFIPVSNVATQNAQTESGESNQLEQTLEQLVLRIPNQKRPIFSDDANRLAFVQQLKQHNPDMSVSQLNAINAGEASSILRIFNDKTRNGKSNGSLSGDSAKLLESIESVLQKYRQNNELLPPLREPIFSGENNLLESVQKIQQKSSIPINFGEADLLKFVRRIENQNPKFTPNQLSTIIGGGTDSIIDILTENKQKEDYSGFHVIESGEADLLVAIQYYVETYVKPDAVQPPTSFVAINPSLQYTQSNQAQTTAVNQLPQAISSSNQPLSQSARGQLTTVGTGNSYYQFSNQNQGNAAGVNEKALYSIEQNKQSQISNQHSQSTQSQITKNVFRGQDNIYTQTAISHKTRSQSTSLNSQKIHYKITQTVPYQQQQQQPAAAPVQFIQSSVSSTKSPNTYIPPPVTPSSYSFASTQASKQVFTYPAVIIGKHEVRNSTLAHRDTDKRQRTLHSRHGSKEHHANAPDKRHADDIKNHQSTDLFLKGLHLSFFENNDSNRPDYYRTHERAETPVRKRKSPLDFGNFSGKRNNNNNNQLIVSKLTVQNSDTNDSNKRNNNETETTKTGLDTATRANDGQNFKMTSTIDKAVRTTQKPRTLNSDTEPFLIRETEARRQIASVNIAKNPINYQSISHKNEEAQQLPASQAFVFTEIENRPLVNYDIPHPPLQTVYPKSIQNNIVSLNTVNRPTVQRYSAPPIPHSLPSIVHEPSNTVATIQNIPATLASSLNAQRHPLPVITSTYSNRESYSNANAREKVVVKVVKADGWYLNDANERRSYYDAVARGLLNENGLVYVNNVQKDANGATYSAQNLPIDFIPSKFASPAFSQSTTLPTGIYAPQNSIPSAISQSQSVGYPTGNLIQSFNGINYWPPCAIAAYHQHVQNSQTSSSPSLQQQQQQQQPPQAQSRQLSFDKPSNNIADNLYSGRSSYNVDLQSVGRLAGDNDKHQYNLSSLHQISRPN